MGLRWNGVEGNFFDDKGRLIAFDPSINQTGPRALLIREDAFDEFLSKAGCDLFWTYLGERHMIGGHMRPEKWQGRLELTGAFRRSVGDLLGGITPHHRQRST